MKFYKEMKKLKNIKVILPVEVARCCTGGPDDAVRRSHCLHYYNPDRDCLWLTGVASRALLLSLIVTYLKNMYSLLLSSKSEKLPIIEVVLHNRMRDNTFFKLFENRGAQFFFIFLMLAFEVLNNTVSIFLHFYPFLGRYV